MVRMGAVGVGGGQAIIVVSRKGADRLRAGHLWVYRSDVLSGGEGGGRGGVAAERGALVTVVDSRRIALGTGLYSSASQIAVRMVSRLPEVGRAAYLEEVRQRLGAAIRLREELAPRTAGNDARRLVFSEADGLPGMVVDEYNDLVVVQLLTQGTAQDDVRATLAEVLGTELRGGSGTIWERPDARVRELEVLDRPPEGPLLARGEARMETVFTINGLQFAFDVGSGQKTGAFLDQRLNYQAAAASAAGGGAGAPGGQAGAASSGGSGRALDVCTYQGGFALHLARVCGRVTGVDASRSALEVADRNLERNRSAGTAMGAVDWIEADAFELLRAFDEAGERFGAIVLDPPAFAKSKRAAEGAARGYKELNLRAMRMLEPGGTLVTCSCSHHIARAEFLEILSAAAVDAGRRVQVLEVRGAAPDHPEVLTLPETGYLKCVICRVG